MADPFKTILLAEDDPGHEALMRRALANAGLPCRIEAVHDGVEVIDYLFGTGSHAGRDTTQMPSLILLDLKMPRMDGLQVLQVLRRVRGNERGNLPPVVVLTSSSEDLDVVNAYRLGAHSFIHKPVDFHQLAETLKQVISYWLVVNQSPPNNWVHNQVAGTRFTSRFMVEERGIECGE